MEWIIGIVIFIILSIIFAKNIRDDATNSKGQDYNQVYVVDTDNIDTGEVTQVAENICINPKSPLPLTLKNLSISEAKQIKGLLEKPRWKSIDDIIFLIAQHNIKCVELEEFINKLRLEANNYIEKRKQESDEWIESSEKDKTDLILEFQQDAIENLSVRPADEWALETLLFSSPEDVTADDQLLELFSENKGLYSFYISKLEYESRVSQVPPDGYDRKNWETLTDLGLAKRGKDIPIKAVLNRLLTMKDINEYFSDRLEKKFTRKAQAIEFVATQPDAIDILSKHIIFRELFQILKFPSIDTSAITACYNYAAAQAKIIYDTWQTSYETLDTLNDVHKSNCKSWEIESDGCCPQCEKLDGKITKRRPSKLPPYHVGCTCSVIASIPYPE